ncbi:UNVERIFIED_CONTAM: hypothetical protein K2H54_032324 [Gekko kuhli]
MSGEKEEEGNATPISKDEEEISQISASQGAGSNATETGKILEVPEMNTNPDILQPGTSSSSSRQQEQKSGEFLKNLTDLLESADEVSQRDSEKDTLPSPKKIEISQKIPVISIPETKDTDLMAYMYAEGICEIPSDFFEGRVRKSLLQSIENAKPTEKVSIDILSELMLDDYTVQLNAKGLTEIPTGIFNIKELKCLQLNHNEIKIIPKAIENKIKIIPSEVCQLQELKDLNLSNNYLVSFPNEICQLSSLEKLTLCQKNGLKLSQLPEKISELSSLKELDVSHNELKELPEGLGEIKTLVTLIANANCLTKLPKRFSSLYSLQRLNLRDNKILALPSDLQFLQSLKDIDFDGNALIRPPLEVCKGKQILTITRYLQRADERDEKILQSVLKIIASNISFENFEFFCQKLQLKNDVYKSIENNRSITVEEKVTQALDHWKTENEALSPAAMTDQLIRVLTMTGLYYLTNKAKALKLCSRLVKF